MKVRLKQLFLNYCDFSIENGNLFITYTNFMKLLKDASVFDNDRVKSTNLNLLISSECLTTNTVKAITFEQFLNCILRISELKFPTLYNKHQKSALNSLLHQYLLPLLERIESAVEH